MTQQPAAEDGIRRAVADLITVFENLGPEHQALLADQQHTAARERRGTVVRMGEGIAHAAHAVFLTIGVLSKVQGIRDLGVDRQFAKDAEGGDYLLLPNLPSSTEELGDAVAYLGKVVAVLDGAYTPTKKHPGLAVARCPYHMKAALSGLRAALDAACAAFADDHADAEVEDYVPVQSLLTELEDRVCRTIPAQGTGPPPRMSPPPSARTPGSRALPLPLWQPAPDPATRRAPSGARSRHARPRPVASMGTRAGAGRPDPRRGRRYRSAALSRS